MLSLPRRPGGASLQGPEAGALTASGLEPPCIVACSWSSLFSSLDLVYKLETSVLPASWWWCDQPGAWHIVGAQ